VDDDDDDDDDYDDDDDDDDETSSEELDIHCAYDADNGVQSGRESLEMCIGKANNWHKYSAAGQAAAAAHTPPPPPELCVVYGDTDSMFVHVLPKAHSTSQRHSQQQQQQQQQLLHDAFDRMREFTRACNALLPNPMELELEKIFLPCILVTKKRYVGMAFENSKQVEGTFDAKGVESVRRDTCPLVQVSRAA
jgi:DNA polymerase zeta